MTEKVIYKNHTITKTHTEVISTPDLSHGIFKTIDEIKVYKNNFHIKDSVTEVIVIEDAQDPYARLYIDRADIDGFIEVLINIRDKAIITK